MPENPLTKAQETELKEEVQKKIDQSPEKSRVQIEKEVKTYAEKRFDLKLSKEDTQTLSHRIISKTARLKNEFRDRAATAIVAAFGFVIAISWQDLIVNLVKTYTKTAALAQYPYIAQLITAAIVTFIAVIGIMLVSSWATKK